MRSKLSVQMLGIVLVAAALAQAVEKKKAAPRAVAPSQTGAPPVIMVGTGPIAPPSFFKAFGPNVPSSTTMELSWMDNSNNEGDFRISRKIVSQGSYPTTPIAILPANTIKYHDSGLEPETTYSYILAASRNGQDWSTAVETTAMTNPRPPQNLQATPLTGLQIRLTWVNSSNSAQLIMIERSIGSPGAFQKIFQTEPINIATYTDKDIKPNTKYFYRLVVLKLPFNASDYTPVASATSLAQ